MRRSRRLAVSVNLVKLLLIAALAPFVVAGIAKRAALFADVWPQEQTLAVTAALGALGAVAGALVFGWLADLGPRPERHRWPWVLCATVIGTAGIFTAMSPSLPALIIGWVVAQFGYSGGMALLRIILAGAQSAHRRRGSVVLVLGSYLGAFLPIAFLVALPESIWALASVLSVLCVLAAASAAAVDRRGGFGGTAGEPAQTCEPERRAEPGAEHGRAAGDALERAPDRGAGRVPGWTVLLVQFAAAALVAAFLTFHPLDLDERVLGPGHEDALVRSSALVLAAALAGLFASATALIVLPRLFGRLRALLVSAALLFVVSIALRAAFDTMPLISFAAFLSGAAVGINSSSLLVAALEVPKAAMLGRFIGVYSAAGALGQFVGPLLGLALLGTAPPGEERFALLFSMLACAPLVWCLLLAISKPRRQRPGRPSAAAASSP